MRVALATGEVLGRLGPCWSWRCSPCCAQRMLVEAERLRLGVLDAQARGDVVTLVTLTAPRRSIVTAKDARDRFRRWQRALGRRVDLGAFAAVLHPHELGGLHVHALAVTSDRLSHALGRRLALATGFGPIFDVRPVEVGHEHAARVGYYLASPLREAWRIPAGGKQLRVVTYSTAWPKGGAR